MIALHKYICIKLGELESPGRWSASHWVGHLVWTVAESEKAVEHTNLHALDAWLESNEEGLFSDQRRDLYDRLLRRIMRASLPKWKDDAEGKKLRREPFIAWLKGQIAEVKGISTSKAGETLRGKMVAAGIEPGVVETAIEAAMVRHHYGPWDKRYYHVLAFLEARGLAAAPTTGCSPAAVDRAITLARASTHAWWSNGSG